MSELVWSSEPQRSTKSRSYSVPSDYGTYWLRQGNVKKFAVISPKAGAVIGQSHRDVRPGHYNTWSDVRDYSRLHSVDHAMVISNQPLAVVDHQVERRLTDLDTTRTPQLASIGPFLRQQLAL